MPGPGPIGQPVVGLKDLGSQGILARTFSVPPGPLGANRLQMPGTAALVARAAGADRRLPRWILPIGRLNCRQINHETRPAGCPVRKKTVTCSGPRRTRGKS